MAAKEQEEEVPAALLQVPTPSYTLLGVTGTHISSFYISKTFQIIFSYHSQSFCFCTVPDNYMVTIGLKLRHYLKAHQLKLCYTFRNFGLLLSSSPVYILN